MYRGCYNGRRVNECTPSAVVMKREDWFQPKLPVIIGLSVLLVSYHEANVSYHSKRGAIFDYKYKYFLCFPKEIHSKKSLI